jgi:hypothetical protein
MMERDATNRMQLNKFDLAKYLPFCYIIALSGLGAVFLTALNELSEFWNQLQQMNAGQIAMGTGLFFDHYVDTGHYWGTPSGYVPPAPIADHDEEEHMDAVAAPSAAPTAAALMYHSHYARQDLETAVQPNANYIGSLSQETTVRLGATGDLNGVSVPFDRVMPIINPHDRVFDDRDINLRNSAPSMGRARDDLEGDLRIVTQHHRPPMETRSPSSAPLIDFVLNQTSLSTSTLYCTVSQYTLFCYKSFYALAACASLRNAREIGRI